MIVDISKAELAINLVDCQTVLTQEFAENALSSVSDAWLLRKHVISGESMINFFANTAEQRLEFYDSFTACDPRLILMAFSELVGMNIKTNKYNIEYFKKVVQKYSNRLYFEHKLDVLNSSFKYFYNNDLEPYFSTYKPQNPDFLDDILSLVFDKEPERRNYYEPKYIIKLVQVTERVKRVFIKYCMGAFLHMDKYNGIYTQAYGMNNMQKSQINNYKLSAKHIEKMTDMKEPFDSEKLRPTMSSVLLNSDMQTVLYHLKIKQTDEIGDAFVQVYESFVCYKGIFDKYESIRGTLEGDTLRNMLIVILLEFRCQGGLTLDNE